jgi:hypothetical protein
MGFGGEDPKSPREPLPAARDGLEEKKRTRVLRGRSTPLYRLETKDSDMFRPGARHVQLAGYVRAIGRTCPVKTASAVPETARKIDIQ